MRVNCRSRNQICESKNNQLFPAVLSVRFVQFSHLDVALGTPRALGFVHQQLTTSCPIRIRCPWGSRHQSPTSSGASRHGRHGRQSPCGHGPRCPCRCQSGGHRRRSSRRTPCVPSVHRQSLDPFGPPQSPSCRHGRLQSPSCRRGPRGPRGRCDSHLGHHHHDPHCGSHPGHPGHLGHRIRDGRRDAHRLCRDPRGMASRCRDPPPREAWSGW
mmetsp:Transcript_14304/g.40816  ORF Transcript_14304/g.40816 Transcript_14304/m.40816 type:complete len:214 (-) Transcript_14304:2080-2721(-)